MEFSVSKKALLDELSLLQGVTKNGTTIPILGNVLVEAVKDRIVFTATNLETTIRSSCPATVKKQGSGTIPSKKLLDYARLLPDAAINIKFTESFYASLVCGNSRARIAGMSRESFPNMPEALPPMAEIPAAVLASLIARTEFAISREENRFTLNGALLLLTRGRVVMVATDGHRLAYVEAPLDNAAEERVIVPRMAMRQLVKLIAEEKDPPPVQFSQDSNSLFFRVGERLLVSLKMTGNFPDYLRVLPKDQDHSLVIDREALTAAIARVSEFSDERSNMIRMQVSKGEIKLWSSDVAVGDSEESVGVEYEGRTLDEIGLNAKYLREFLTAIADRPQVIMLLPGGKGGAVEMRPAGDKAEYRYIVMPMAV